MTQVHFCSLWKVPKLLCGPIVTLFHCQSTVSQYLTIYIQWATCPTHIPLSFSLLQLLTQHRHHIPAEALNRAAKSGWPRHVGLKPWPCIHTVGTSYNERLTLDILDIPVSYFLPQYVPQNKIPWRWLLSQPLGVMVHTDPKSKLYVLPMQHQNNIPKVNQRRTASLQ